MKNNKGFTLTEILITLVILTIIMIIVYPTVSNIIFSSRNAVNKLAIKNIKESSEMFAQDVYLCDASTEILNILKADLKYPEVTNCQTAKVRFKKGITLTLDVLLKYDYAAKIEKCTGNVILTLSGEKLTNIDINTNNIKCTG